MRPDLSATAGSDVRGTTLHGIAKKAVDTFELLFRGAVDVYRNLAEHAQTEEVRERANRLKDRRSVSCCNMLEGITRPSHALRDQHRSAARSLPDGE
jgi:hypothetical protein